MQILFIAPRLPLPADTGGKIRTLNILKQLMKQAKIHLVCFSFSSEDKELRLLLENDGVEVTLVPARELSVPEKIVQVLFESLPVSVSKYYSDDMESILTELNETNQFDAVHIDHLHMAHYFKCLRGVPCVLDDHNVEFKILERCANVEKSLLKRIIFKFQAKKMKLFEKISVENMASYLAVSEDDKTMLDQLAGNKSSGYVVPNGVDTEYFNTQALNGLTQEEEAIVFTGSMDWLPNDDAAIYFCNKILPLVWKERPNVKFYIVGKGPTVDLRKCAESEDRIVLAGRVDDVRVFVEKSKIFVVPLRIGGGTRLKILEAMSMQKAIISTRIGAEGIAYLENENIILEDEPQEFAQQVIALLDDDQKRKAMGNAGRKLVLEKYDWNIIGKVLGKIYGELKK